MSRPITRPPDQRLLQPKRMLRAINEWILDPADGELLSLEEMIRAYDRVERQTRRRRDSKGRLVELDVMNEKEA